MDSTNRLSLRLLILSIIVFVLLLIFIPKEQTNFINIIGVLGTIASIFGLLIAYFQIKHLRNTSEKVKEEIDETLKKIKKSYSLSNIGKAITLINTIENFVMEEKNSELFYYKKDLIDKISLIELDEIEFTDELNNLKTLVLIELDLIIFNKSKKNINKQKVLKNLQNFHEFLNSLEKKTQIK